jgi:hypothetical protein
VISKLAESSGKGLSTQHLHPNLRPIYYRTLFELEALPCSKIRVKKFALKVRRNFQTLAFFTVRDRFSLQKEQHRFSFFASQFLLQKRPHLCGF